MKNLFVLAAMCLCMAGIAQERSQEPQMKEKKEAIKNLSPEQLATLKTKQMTLALDLNPEQQDKIYQFNLDKIKHRKAQMDQRKESSNKKISSEERYNRMNEHLDRKIEAKQQLSKILTQEQLDKLQKIEQHKRKKGMAKRRIKKEE